MAKEIIEKIQNNEYDEVLAYDPAKDKGIRISEPKPKWIIPDIMIQRV